MFFKGGLFENVFVSFFIGGALTAAITYLELTGESFLSGIATIVPVFTLISYLVIGTSETGVAISQHAKFVLYGTIVTWIPYMVVIIVLSPRVGTFRAIGCGLLLFSVLAVCYVASVERMHLFR